MYYYPIEASEIRDSSREYRWYPKQHDVFFLNFESVKLIELFLKNHLYSIFELFLYFITLVSSVIFYRLHINDGSYIYIIKRITSSYH